MKTNKQKQTKVSVTLDAHPDVLEMFTRAMNEIRPRPSQVSIAVEAFREYLPKILGEKMNNNGNKEHGGDNLEKQAAGLKVTPEHKLSAEEVALAKKLKAELAKPKKRKGGK